ncbi:MAG: hypothetical protein DSZ24_05590 [Thermodesulfatator sp.]|nr:MAG: hypothetical protein DSZ24_05590 [Thermodesulfatator sp.]
MIFKRGGPEDINGYIGSGLKLEGKLSFPGKVRFEGEMQGELRGDFLIIGEKGRIVGEVEAKEIICAGEIEGRLRCQNLCLRKTARIRGEIFTDKLAVEEGARIEGQIKAVEEVQTPPLTGVKGAA